MTIAVYPGTFDPVTNGHMDIIARASALFEKLMVAVYAHPQKDVLFTAEQRVDMMRKAVGSFKNVEVESYEGLTVNYMRLAKAQVMVRGLRVISDFEWEFQMALLNKKLDPGLEMVCFMTSLEYSFLSSSIVRQIAELGGCVNDLVPPHVVLALGRVYRERQGASVNPHDREGRE